MCKESGPTKYLGVKSIINIAWVMVISLLVWLIFMKGFDIE